MKSYDFEYDGLRLSDKGFMICRFDSGGVDTVSNGSEITFNTVSTMHGIKHELTSVEYGDCLTTTFQICKNLCLDKNEEISLEDMRDIMRWLNRKSFHKFKLIDDEYTGIYFEASFNVSKIEVDGRLCGFELEVFTNRPFALQEPVTISMNITSDKLTETCTMANGTIISNVCFKNLYSKSDEEGYIYPNMEVTINQSGDLKIYNVFEDRLMIIENCEIGEVITLNYPLIDTTYDSHKKTIMNDFNWQFFRIASDFKNRLNKIAISLPCTIKMTYSPIVKVGI